MGVLQGSCYRSVLTFRSVADLLTPAISIRKKDVKRLRIDHHISGVLSGTLPQVAQQNVFLGLPLQLLPEEVAVLLHHRELARRSFPPLHRSQPFFARSLIRPSCFALVNVTF